MALDGGSTGDPFLDAWQAAMQQTYAQQPAPLAVTEYGSTVPIGPIGPTPMPAPPPPPPPPPPPQRIGPDEQIEETAPPAAAVAAVPPVVQPTPAQMPPQSLPGFVPLDPSSWAGAPLTPDMPLEQPGPELAPPMPQVDAVSGVGAAPPDGSIIMQQAPQVAPRTSAGEGEQSLSTEEILALNPIQRAAYFDDEQRKRMQMANAGMADIQRTDAARAEEAERIYLDSQKRAQDMTAAAIADSEALANEKPKKYMDSIGNAVGAVLGVLFGQFGAGATGGKNMGLEMLNRQMDAFSQDQLNEYNRKSGNVDRKLNIAARLREAGYSEYQTKAVIRMAGLQRAREHLLTDIQNYDPRGTAAMQRAQTIKQTEAAMAQHAEAMRRDNLKEQIELAKNAREAQEANDKHLAAQAKLHGTGGASTALDKQVLDPQALAKMFGGPAPPVAMSVKDYRNSYLATTEKAAQTNQAIGAETPAQKRERELGIVGPDGKPLVNEKGEQVKGRDIDESKKLTTQIADTDEVIRLMDNVLRLRQKYGWSSDLLKSAEWREMQSDWGEVILKKKNIAELGVIAGPDMDLMGKALGAADPTSVQDPTAGIARGRTNAVEGLHGRLRIKGVADESLPKYPETWKKQAPAPNSIDEAIDEVTKADQLVDDRPGAVPLGPTGAPAGVTKEAYESFKGQTTQVRNRVQFLEDTARGGGDNGKKARQGLLELSTKAASPLMRDAAAQALRNLDASTAATQEETK